MKTLFAILIVAAFVCAIVFVAQWSMAASADETQFCGTITALKGQSGEVYLAVVDDKVFIALATSVEYRKLEVGAGYTFTYRHTGLVDMVEGCRV